MIFSFVIDSEGIRGMKLVNRISKVNGVVMIMMMMVMVI